MYRITVPGFLFSLIAVFVFFSCNNTPVDNSDSVDVEQVVAEEAEMPVTIEAEEGDTLKKVFYDLTSPVELTEFVRFSNTSFDKEILNSTENIQRYNINLKLALNMGVYGTDMIYCRMFEMKQDAMNYLASIKKLTREIGIPDEQISGTLGKADRYMDNKDSIFTIIQEAYLNADGYLKESDRNSTAALIYFGGWAEALNLAVQLYYKEGSDKEKISSHIAEQKFALNNIHVLLNNTYDSEDIHHYLVMVSQLKKVYDDITIIAEDSGSAKVDTLAKTIIVDTGKNQITEEQIEKISKIINRIRKDIVS